MNEMEQKDASSSLPTLEDIQSSMRSPDAPKKLTKRDMIDIGIVYFSVFLDNMGVSIVQPILPFYAEEFGADSFQLGMLYSSYSLMATFATIFMAKMSDRVGRRPMICFSLFGTLSGFLVTAFAWNYPSLLACRFYTGAFGGSFSVAQAYMTDSCPPDVLEKYLAGIGGVMAIAFIIGPLLGGTLAGFGLNVPFFASAVAGGVGFLVAIFFLEESYHPDKRKEHKKKQRALSDSSEDEEMQTTEPLTSKKAEEMASDKEAGKQGNKCAQSCHKMSAGFKAIPVQVWMVLVSYFLATIGWCTFTAMFAQYLIDEYGLNEESVAMITVIIGTVYVIANVVIFTFLAKKIGIYWLSAAGLILFGVCLGFAPITRNIYGMMVLMCGGVGIGNGVLMPCMSAMGADFANDDNRGTVLGWITVGNQAAFVVGPLIMGWLYGIERDLIFFVGAGFVGAALIPIVLLLAFWPETRSPKKFDDDFIPDVEYWIKHPDEWVYKADEPKQADYVRLGKDLGKMLILRGYRWKTHYPDMVQAFDLAFPELRTDNFENYYEDCSVIRKHLEKTKWSFRNIKALEQVSFGEATKVIYS